jgi:hypothetical protein
MTAEIITLEQLDWIVIRADSVYGESPDYRSCDVCFLSALEDVWTGKDTSEFRQFFRVSGGKYGPLDVCEHCLEDLLQELRDEPS